MYRNRGRKKVRRIPETQKETDDREKTPGQEAAKTAAQQEEENNILYLLAVGDNYYHDAILAQGEARESRIRLHSGGNSIRR